MTSFSNYLERWRQEPEAKRQRRAFFFAATLTLILFVLWLGSFRLSASLRTNPTSSQPASPSVIERIKAGWQTITQ